MDKSLYARMMAPDEAMEESSVLREYRVGATLRAFLRGGHNDDENGKAAASSLLEDMTKAVASVARKEDWSFALTPPTAGLGVPWNTPNSAANTPNDRVFGSELTNTAAAEAAERSAACAGDDRAGTPATARRDEGTPAAACRDALEAASVAAAGGAAADRARPAKRSGFAAPAKVAPRPRPEAAAVDVARGDATKDAMDESSASDSPALPPTKTPRKAVDGRKRVRFSIPSRRAAPAAPALAASALEAAAVPPAVVEEEAPEPPVAAKKARRGGFKLAAVARAAPAEAAAPAEDAAEDVEMAPPAEEALEAPAAPAAKKRLFKLAAVARVAPAAPVAAPAAREAEGDDEVLPPAEEEDDNDAVVDEAPPPPAAKKKRPRAGFKLAATKRVAPDGSGARAPLLDHEPLVLWTPKPGETVAAPAPAPRRGFNGALVAAARRKAVAAAPVVVPPLLAQFLRPHQREGVQFLYDCVAGLREYAHDYSGQGAILADDMGLGKTLQTVALVYALLQRGSVGDGSPVKRVVVACPCSLVPNWKAEFDKWVNARAGTKAERVDCRAVDGKVGEAIDAFLSPGRPFHVLLISYESLKLHVAKLSASATACDLLVCDEAQRLKGRKTQLSAALGSLRCARRILLTGTPVQNDLDEFFALADFANPGVLGTPDAFRKTFDAPIAKGLLRGAAPGDVKLAQDRQKILSLIAGRFLLRRENKLNAAHLPPKLVQVLVCRPAAPQRRAIAALLGEKRLQHALAGKQADVLAYIGRYKKICDHPSLDDDAGCDARARFSGERKSGKLHVLYRLLRELRGNGGQERVVVVANQTSSLELVSRLCSREGWPWCMLDGKTPLKQRKLLNDEFNDPACEHHFCFLLSSTAGGCGLNLIGGSRLVLFDSSWNPATDKQAAARCWRDGNPRRCYTYRLLTAGTIEEKIYQRQLAKEGLACVVEDRAQVNTFDADELHNLFAFDDAATSDTHACLGCACGAGGLDPKALAARAARALRTARDADAVGPKRSAAVAAYLAAAADDVLRLAPDAGVVVTFPPHVPRAAPPAFFAVRAEGEGDVVALADPASGKTRSAVLPARIQPGDEFQVRFPADDAPAPGDAVATALRSLAASLPATIPEVRKALLKPFDDGAKAGHGDALAAAKARLTQTWAAFVPDLQRVLEDAPPDEEDDDDDDGGADKPACCTVCKPQVGLPAEEDLLNWSHHGSVDSVDDDVLKAALADKPGLVSFAFGMRVDADLVKAALAQAQA